MFEKVIEDFIWNLLKFQVFLVAINALGGLLFYLSMRGKKATHSTQTNTQLDPPPKPGNPKNMDKLAQKVLAKVKLFLVYIGTAMLVFAFLGFYVATPFYWGLEALLVLLVVSLYVVVFFIATLFIIRGLAERKVGWTTVTSGTIAYVIAGESLVRTIPNVPGKILEPDNDDNQKIPLHHRQLINGDSEKEKTWLEREYGIYWAGFPPFRKKKRFGMTKERENPNISAKTKPEDWISKPEPFETDELRHSFPRPVLVPDVEFKGGFKANIMMLSHFEVTVPWKPIFKLNAQFFPIISSHVRSGVISYCQSLTFEDFLSAKKDDANAMSDEILRIIKDRLLEETGICISGMSVSTYDASDKETQEILEAREKARMKGDARIEAVEKEQKAAEIEAETFRLVQVKKSQAANLDLITSVTALVELGVDPNVAMTKVAEVKQAQEYTSKDSKITVLMNGGNGGAPSLAVPINTAPPTRTPKPTEEEKTQ